MFPTPAGLTISSPGMKRCLRTWPPVKICSVTHDEIIRRRVIMNFQQGGMDTEQVLKGLEALLVHGNYLGRTIIVDGFNFYLPAAADVKLFKQFAVEHQLRILVQLFSPWR